MVTTSPKAADEEKRNARRQRAAGQNELCLELPTLRCYLNLRRRAMAGAAFFFFVRVRALGRAQPSNWHGPASMEVEAGTARSFGVSNGLREGDSCCGGVSKRRWPPSPIWYACTRTRFIRLAYRVVGDASLAQEATATALLKIWNKAKHGADASAAPGSTTLRSGPSSTRNAATSVGGSAGLRPCPSRLLARNPTPPMGLQRTNSNARKKSNCTPRCSSCPRKIVP